MKNLFRVLVVVIILVLSLSTSNTEAQFSKGQPFSAQVSWLSGDTSKVIVAAPGAAGTIWVTFLACTLTTTAAVAWDIDNGSTVDILRFGVSAPINTVFEVGPMIKGISLGANTPLQYTPASAGPVGNCIAEGYIVRTGA